MTLLLLLLSSLLLHVTFVYFSLFPLAWVALVPYFLIACRVSRRSQSLLIHFLFGFSLFCFNLSWIACINPLGIFPLAFYFSLYFIALGEAIFFFKKHFQKEVFLILPFLWISMEYLQGHIFCGFPWFLLAYTQQKFLPLIQSARLLGPYFVSFLVVLPNALLAYVLCPRLPAFSPSRLLDSSTADGQRPPPRLFPPVVLLSLCLYTGLLLYGWFELNRPLPKKALITVSIVQGNIPQSLRNQPPEYGTYILNTYLHLTAEVPPQTQLILWPEGTYPYPVDLHERWERREISTLSKMFEHPWITGFFRRSPPPSAGEGLSPSAFRLPPFLPPPSLRESQEEEIFYNSALLAISGHIQNVYDKVHLVPFGEYIPMDKRFLFIRRLLEKFVPLDDFYDLTPGHAFPLFYLPPPSAEEGQGEGHSLPPPLGGRVRVRGSPPPSAGERTPRLPASPTPLSPVPCPLTADCRLPFGVLICYESIFPEYTRGYRQRGARFIVNLSNDGWFKHSAELDQAQAIAVFRAVENGLGFVRATNTGISSIIQPNGKLSVLKKNGDKKEVAGLLTGPVYSDPEETLYTRVGDIFPFLCALALLTLCLLRKAFAFSAPQR